MRLLKLIFVIVATVSCSSSKQGLAGETVVWEISPELAYCEGVSIKKCMQVRDKGSNEWTLFYDMIKGFEYKEGTRYTVQLEKSQIDHPVADGSSISYKLVKILDEEVLKIMLEPTFRGHYTVTHLYGEGVTQKDLSFGINNQKRRVYGFSGCNNYTVQFLQKDNKLTFKPVATTKKHCQNSQAIERTFLSVFKQVKRYDRIDGKLLLYNRDGDKILQGKIGDPF